MGVQRAAQRHGNGRGKYTPLLQSVLFQLCKTMLRRKTAGPGPGGSTQPAGSGRSRAGQASKKSRVRQDMRPESKRCAYCGPQVWSHISKGGQCAIKTKYVQSERWRRPAPYPRQRRECAGARGRRGWTASRCRRPRRRGPPRAGGPPMKTLRSKNSIQ